MKQFRIEIAALLGLLWAADAAAASAPFDLAGPDIQVTVTRGGATLPIAAVPNLAPGDRLWLKAAMPPDQSAKYLMVVAFLRGATNPPPANWFFRDQTWSRNSRARGLTVTVPVGAQQVLVFLAPSTGGDFRTLVGAVSGRPGAFVRASQDLNQASLDRSRLFVYMTTIAALNRSEPSRLGETAPVLARSLGVKVDETCFELTAALRAACLTRGQETLILNDGHSTSIVTALTSGPASDLAMEASFTPQLNYGYYSPYIASVLDIARIFDAFRTAQYQYIPAIAAPRDNQMSLALNTPPSFHNPMSVLVAALPAVETAQLPPLRMVDPKQAYCGGMKSLVVPVEGAPLVFSSAYAHDLALRVSDDAGKSYDLPARADAQRGGFVIDTTALGDHSSGETLMASLRGAWGFDEYAGPGVQLVVPRPQNWSLAAGEDGTLIVGRDNTVRLRAGSVACLQQVSMKDASGRDVPLEWKPVKAAEVEVKIPLLEARPGIVTIQLAQHGGREPETLPLRSYVQAGHHDQFSIAAGDTQGVLKGTRLEEVAGLSLHGIKFLPGAAAGSRSDQLSFVMQDPGAASSLKPGDAMKARLALEDGRTLEVDAVVTASRPSVALIDKSVQMPAAGESDAITLTTTDQLPQGATLKFSLRAQLPASFAPDLRVEVATIDESFATTLNRATGTLILEDRSIAVATLDPAKSLGVAAFGALKYRVLTANTESAWQPLATLVRLPVFHDLKCPANEELGCKLSGANLFLVDAIANNPQFEAAVNVPAGFPGDSLPVPRPIDRRLYVKLHDAPSVINYAVLTPKSLAAP